MQKVTLFSGSDGIFYRNQCKLDATNCELGTEISPSEVSKCQNPEPSKPKPARLSEIESPESEMNDSQISQVIEPPIEDLTNQKSSRYVTYRMFKLRNRIHNLLLCNGIIT